MDKYRGITTVPIVEARIGHLLARLRENIARGVYSTQEDVARAVADIAVKYASGQQESVYHFPSVNPGDPLQYQYFLDFFIGIYSELSYLSDAVKASADLIQSNFNFTAAKINYLQNLLKYCDDRLSIYSLYTNNFGDNVFIGDTFATANNVDIGSSLVGTKECSLDLKEGTVTLPVTSTDTWPIDKVVIGSLSNGVPGNNQEISVPLRGDINAVKDGNTDTWFEYEKVVTSEDNIGLRLDLKLALSEAKPINSITIHPVFFGARTPPSLEAIDVSEDGREWKPLNSLVNVASFLGEKPADKFVLAPSSGRFSGEFVINFSPIFVKFVRVLIHQSSTYFIRTGPEQKKQRYAIGIKEIIVQGKKFDNEGDLISKELTLPREVRHVAMLSTVDPADLPESVGGVEHYVSFDDGASWTAIETLDAASNDVDEIFSTNDPVTKLRYKLYLHKDPASFEKIVEVPEHSTREVYSRSTTLPQTIRLLNAPVDGTVQVVSPSVIGCGKSYPKFRIGDGIFSSLHQNIAGTGFERVGNTQLRIPIPTVLLKDLTKLNIFVAGNQWSKVTSFTASPYAKEYMLSYTSDGILEAVFGNGEAINPAGSIPTTSDSISATLDIESVSVTGFAAPYKVKLDYFSDGDKEQTTIYYKESATPTVRAAVFIPTGVGVFKLPFNPVALDNSGDPVISIEVGDLSGTTIEFSSPATSYSSLAGNASYKTLKDFVDGSSELTTNGDWSIDVQTSTIYVKNPPTYIHKIICRYSTQATYYLSPSDWDFVPGKLDEIYIYESGFFATSGSDTISSGIKQKDLGVHGIVYKSVRFSDGIFGSGYQPYEIPFIDGVQEFNNLISLQEEEIPTTSFVAQGDGRRIASWQVTHYDTMNANGGAYISNNSGTFDFAYSAYKIFVDGDSELTSDGDWTIDWDTGYVYLCSTGLVAVPSGEAISYQYEDLFASERLIGAFAVNYKEGIVYFATATTATGTVDFRYSPYFVKYNVSIPLSESTHYSISYPEKKVTIMSGGNQLIGEKIAIYYRYRVAESRIKELAPYFSPLVRGMAIKAT